MSKVVVTVLVLGFLWQDVDNPSYQRWSKFKPRSRVTLHSDNLTNGIKSEAEIIYTLKSIDAQEAVVTMTGSTTVQGKKTDMKPSDARYPAKVKLAEPAKDAPKPEEGVGEIEVAGKKLKCRWTRTVRDVNGLKTTTTTWTHESVPGGTAKIESVTEGRMKMTSTQVVTAIERK